MKGRQFPEDFHQPHAPGPPLDRRADGARPHPDRDLESEILRARGGTIGVGVWILSNWYSGHLAL